LKPESDVSKSKVQKNKTVVASDESKPKGDKPKVMVNQKRPKPHLKVHEVKSKTRIFRYLKGTTNLGLLYRKFLDYKLIGFCDADYAGDMIERKSTSGNHQFLGGNLISWASKGQATISMMMFML